MKKKINDLHFRSYSTKPFNRSDCPTECVFHELFRERVSLTCSHYRGCHVHLKPLQSVNVDGVCLRSSLPSQSDRIFYSSLTLISLHHLCQHVSVIVHSGFSTGEVCVCVSCVCGGVTSLGCSGVSGVPQESGVLKLTRCTQRQCPLLQSR